MIQICCDTADKIKLTEMTSFQGDLKKRKDKDIEELKESLLNHGLLMPFAIWEHDGKKFLLDGHGRKEVLIKMAVEDPSILTVDWPCVYVEAETIDDAKKALLSISSSFGKFTKEGVKEFTASIPSFVAPSIKKFKAVSKEDTVKVSKPKSDKTVLKIRVQNDKVSQVLDIFKQFNYIEVL